MKDNGNNEVSKKRGGGNGNIRLVAVCAVFTALTCVFTMFIQVPTGPVGGMVHIGNVPLFIAAAFFGKRTGAFVGGVGMALSDLLSGWVPWAPITLITVGCMGFVYALIINGKPTAPRLAAAYAAVLAVKIAGYYIGESVMYGSLVAPLVSVPGNVVQVTVGALAASPVIMLLKSTCGDIICRLRPAGHQH